MLDSKVTYFLGAGVSMDAGYPSTNDLLRRMVLRLRHRRRSATLRRFIEELGFTLASKKSARPPIIEVISLLDACLREDRPLDRFFSVERLRRARNQLTHELSYVLESGRGRGDAVVMPRAAWDQPGAKNRRVARYFKRFARNLRPRDRRRTAPLASGDSIITTNYDTNLDVALFELAYWEESTGDEAYSAIWDVFLGSEFRDPYELDQDAFWDRTRAVDLFKLHGSLNWLYCPRCSRIFIAAFGYSVRFLTGSDEYEKTCVCGFKVLEPVLVAPSAFQDIANPHLQSIWMHAYHVLEVSESWIFAGCSLPPEDLAVRSLLYRALDGRRQKGHKRPQIKVICPAQDVAMLRPRFVGLLGKPIFFRRQRFAEYARAL